MKLITIRQGIPDVKTYLGLKRAVGWPLPDLEAVAAALANTQCGFLVQRADQIVGMATVHGDGALNFYVQDVIIHPKIQRQGYGTRLMDAVMNHINAHARDKAYVALFSAKGLEPFYARYGFIARPVDNFGAGMFFIKDVKEGVCDTYPQAIASNLLLPEIERYKKEKEKVEVIRHLEIKNHKPPSYT